MLRKTTVDKRRRIRWNLTTVLEDLDFEDDMALLMAREDWEIERESSQSRPKV